MLFFKLGVAGGFRTEQELQLIRILLACVLCTLQFHCKTRAQVCNQAYPKPRGHLGPPKRPYFMTPNPSIASILLAQGGTGHALEDAFSPCPEKICRRIAISSFIEAFEWKYMEIIYYWILVLLGFFRKFNSLKYFLVSTIWVCIWLGASVGG